MPLIRQPQIIDSPAIASLLGQLGYDATIQFVEKNLLLLLASETDRILVAEENGTVVGCVSLHALRLFHMEGQLGRMTSFVVDERYRGHGIGRALIAAAEQWFLQVGCVKAEVTSGDRRAAAHAFYESAGYRRDGERLSKRL